MPRQNPSILTQIERLASDDGAIATITLNRPERRNALTVPMMHRLYAAIDECDRDPAVRCIILQAIGPAFCVGQDLNVLSKLYAHQSPKVFADQMREVYQPVTTRISHANKPVIAAIQGVAAGGGWALAMACDLRVATHDARFVPAVAKIGLVPAMGGIGHLVEATGYARAFECLLLREELTAEEALAFGLVNTIVASTDLIPQAQAWARRIAGLSIDAVTQCKRLLRHAAQSNESRGLIAESWAQLGLVMKPEHRAAVDAWRDRSR